MRFSWAKFVIIDVLDEPPTMSNLLINSQLLISYTIEVFFTLLHKSRRKKIQTVYKNSIKKHNFKISGIFSLRFFIMIQEKRKERLRKSKTI